MSERKVKSEEIEPSFNIDNWMKELLPDSGSSGINRTETGSFPVSSSSMNNSMQQNKPVKMEDNSQVATTNSNMKSGMNRNPVNTSGKNTPVGGFSSTSSSANGLALNQNLSHMIRQVDQQFHQQVPAQLIEKPNNYTSSTRLNAYNSSNPMQQQQNRSTASAMFQQQRPTGYQSPSRLMMRNQESLNVIQQPDLSNLQPKQFPRQVQIQQPVSMQSGLVTEHVRPKLMASAFPQPQSRNIQLANPIKSEKQPQQLQGPSQVTQVQMPSPADWLDQAFHQLSQLKAACLPEVEASINKATELSSKAQNNESAAKFEKTRSAYVQIQSFLQMTKSNIEKHGKEIFLKYMNLFRPHLERIRATKALRMQRAQQTNASFSQLVTPQLRHTGTAPQFYGTLPNLPGPLRQQSPASSMSSFQVGSSAGVQILDASNQHSLMRPMQQNSPRKVPPAISIPTSQEVSKIGFKQGSAIKQPSSSHGVPKQFTLSAQQQKVTSPRRTFNLLESSSSEKNSNLNITKSAQQSLSMEHIQQIMQKRNSGSPLRPFVGLNKSGSSSLNVPSPQNSQHSNSLLELSKSRTPPSLANSPSTFPSPLNPLTPISKATDPELGSLSLEESNKVPKASPALVEPSKQNEPVMEPALVTSPLVTEPSIPDKAESSHDAQAPITRLINALNTISPAALQSSIRDLKAIVEMNDRMTGRFYHGQRTRDIMNDLSGDIRRHNDWNFTPMYETGMESRMKRQLDCIASMPEMGCHPNDTVKRTKIEPNDELLREIEEIHQKIMEMVVDARAGHIEKTSIVRCCYCPIGHYGNGIPNTSPDAFPYLALELKVTGDYPRSSPIILETHPPSCSESNEGKRLWLKAMSNFDSAIRGLEQPISLLQMAKTWGVCARGVYLELAVRNGGGSFSTRYGKWESCD